MKRKIITLVLAMAAAAVISTTAMAAEETISGFYDIGTATDVVITPYAGETAVTAQDKNIDEDDAMESVYVDSNRLDVTYGGATANEYYGVILVEGSSLPTIDTEIYYINQETASGSSVAFNVYPKLPAETTDMTLYISSSEAGADLVSVAMNYAVDAAVVPDAPVVPSYRLGDANGDSAVDVKDVIMIRRYITGGYGVTFGDAAADVNEDGIVDVKDAIMIRRFITGGYGVEL